MRAIHSARNSRFLCAAVAVGVLPRLHHRLLGDAEDVLAAAAEALGLREDLLVPGARGYATFDSWHGALLSYAYGSMLRIARHVRVVHGAAPRRWRLFLVVFLVRMWRLNACRA